MALVDEDKTEVKNLITEALKSFKLPEIPPVAPNVEIPVPKPPKSNEELEAEKKALEDKKDTESLGAKIWKALW